jgi:hypothetical protein
LYVKETDFSLNLVKSEITTTRDKGYLEGLEASAEL